MFIRFATSNTTVQCLAASCVLSCTETRGRSVKHVFSVVQTRDDCKSYAIMEACMQSGHGVMFSMIHGVVLWQ